MKITSIELTEINLPLVHFFETSFGRTYERRIILVRVTDADGATGWGEITCGESPGYSDEWTDSAWVTAEKILAPMVVGKQVDSAADVWSLMAWVRGHRMASGRRYRIRRGADRLLPAVLCDDGGIDDPAGILAGISLGGDRD